MADQIKVFKTKLTQLKLAHLVHSQLTVLQQIAQLKLLLKR